MKKKGAAASLGDLSENAAYQMAVEEAEMLRVRFSDVQKMIQSLEKGGG